VYFRRRRMSRIRGKCWQALFLLKCLGYLVLDQINRSRLNVVFYRSYAGLPAKEIKALVEDCHEQVIRPRRFAQASGCIEAHRRAGRRIVCITGSIDFLLAPLMRELAVDDLLAPALVESKGRFTGELDGPPVGDGEKARRIRRFAEAHDLDLSESYAYGDSIADLPMLETVGYPQVVNPDKRLSAVAKKRGWPVHHWSIATTGDAS
jgi:fatty acyl-CoA reductase